MTQEPDPLQASTEARPDQSKPAVRPGADPQLTLPFAAMAEALRANADALRRIDSNQKKIAAAVERSEKATQIVTSTRNLNETFRGLTEIQRSLLDAFVRDRGRGRGMPFVLAVFVVLAALLAFLFYEWRNGEAKVSAAVYADARSAAERLQGENTVLAGRIQQLEARVDAADRVSERDRARLTSLESDKAELEATVAELNQQLALKEASLKEYLVMKEMADRTGTIMVRNTQLEGEVRELKSKLSRAEGERERLLTLIADQRLADLDGNGDLVRERAREMGILPEKGEGEPEAAEPGGIVRLNASARRRVSGQLNRLLRLGTGEITYELLDFGGMKDRRILLDVRLGRYRNAALVGSVVCRELEFALDPERDTLEIRLRDGHLIDRTRPAEEIPIAEDGHSIFLRDLGLAKWLKRMTHSLVLDEDGMLTWKTTPS
jgi:hypothetical protein